MNQILEPTNCSTPARRRAPAVAPVLIRVPALAGADARRPGRSPRRRLRREVRVAGCWLLALVPTVAACSAWGGHRPAPLLAVNSPDRVAPVAPAISLSIEPTPNTPPLADHAECSVFLSGQLLPADPTEESIHGGY